MARSRRRRAGRSARVRVRSLRRCSPRSRGRRRLRGLASTARRAPDRRVPRRRFWRRDGRRFRRTPPRSERLAGVDAHPSADRAAGQRVLCRSPRRRARRRLCGKRRRTSRLACPPRRRRSRRTRCAACRDARRARRRTSSPELVQQPGRALDVREEEGDGAARKLGHRLDDALRRRNSAFLESGVAFKLTPWPSL